MEHTDWKLLAQVYVATLIVFLIVFYKEPILSTITLTLALAAVSYIPGYLLTKKILEHPWQRILLGSATSIALISTSAYYLGLIGLTLNTTAYALPAILIIIGLIINRP